jgi:hypothetical protein
MCKDQKNITHPFGMCELIKSSQQFQQFQSSSDAHEMAQALE